jgi:excisionase family DNA binding protein
MTNPEGRRMDSKTFNSSSNSDTFLTVEQFADLLQFSRHTVYIWVSKSKLPIPYYKFPRGIRFKRSDVDKWIASRRVAPISLIKDTP